MHYLRHHLALFLALVVSACFCSAIVTAKDISTNKEPKAGIHFHNPFPKQAKAMHFTCSSKSFTVLSGQDHDWTVPMYKVESCQVVWGHSSASFDAYDPDIDLGHAVVFLMAKNDGFFHSWDQLTWDKKAGWVGYTQN